MTTEQVSEEDPPHTATTSISVHGLTKYYGSVLAVDELDLEVRSGELFGVLGPNGAGKSTMLEILVGLRERSSGTVEVLGSDPSNDRERLRRLVAVQPQQAELFPNLTVRETLRLWASFHENPEEPEAVIECVGLTGSADHRVHKLSGGQERRLLVATALISRPELIVLDEPSTGLDPNARADLWDVLLAYRDRGGTALLSTHSMEEAESLCDRVAVVDGGKVVACGAPAELVTQHAPHDVVSFRRAGAPDIEDVRAIPGVEETELHGNRVLVHTSRADEVTTELMSMTPAPQNLVRRTGGLDSVFRVLTGRTLDDEKDG
ncbi:ABC transporter ATP-binding protein [Actinopolyspora sp. H202]|uniref:ABC transporter ATP-binding protein n=1 Tax=Actinopolyspora sp. H202 TaxID=1500456 RepID=UPI003EE4FADA